MGRPRRHHAAAAVVARLGLNLRAICGERKLPRSVLYLAFDGIEWAQREARERLGRDLACLLLGEAA